MDFERIVALVKGRNKPKATGPAPPDPAIEFPHPENGSLFTRLRENSKIADPERVMGGYEVRTHPDLISILYDLVAESGVKKGYAYGRPVMANPKGLVFAYAGGTHYVFFKLREDRLDDARRDGGRFDPSYGRDWIEFRLGGRTGCSADWQEAMRRWAHISYQDSLSIGTAT
jgi:hypothetical protein